MNTEIIVIANGLVSVPASTEIWMTQHEIVNLFGYFVSKVSSNIRSILKNGVLLESNVCQIYHYQNGNFVEVYSLELIVALSFRIQSRNAEIFRKWLINKLTKVQIPEILIMHIENPILN